MKKKNYLSKKMFTLAGCMAMTLAISTGCEDEPTKPTPPKIPDCITVVPVTVEDSAVAKQLDVIFEIAAAKMHWENEYTPKRYVINSQDELFYTAFGIGYFIDLPFNIDFTQYTLLGGSFVAIFGGDDIKRVEMCENVSKQEYTLTEVKPVIEGGATLGTYPYSYWWLYPKLNPEFEINFVTDYREVIE